MKYPMAHKIKRPFKYISADDTNIGARFAKLLKQEQAARDTRAALAAAAAPEKKTVETI